jgi:CheY-like chemotaxis protein/HPt (histidine-containing phosphotransfer) domain-containing protein
MGGEIGLISNPNEGSNFWFTIKAKQAIKADVTASEYAENEISFNNYFKNYSPKILLVDDNAVNRKVASEILKKANCIVESADSGQKAIDIFTQNQAFDVILMDIQMPEMDGIETTQILKEKFGSQLPKVVAMTAYSMQHDRENFISKGMDDYISKPIRANLLIKKVEEYISGQKKSGSIVEKVDTEEKIQSGVYQISSEIPEFDPEVISSLRDMVGQEMLLSVFEDFEKEAEEQITHSIEAFKNNDVVTIQKELHTLKGNSGTIGLMRIHEITKDIEVPAKTGNLEGFEKRVDLLMHEFEQFKLKYKNI